MLNTLTTGKQSIVSVAMTSAIKTVVNGFSCHARYQNTVNLFPHRCQKFTTEKKTDMLDILAKTIMSNQPLHRLSFVLYFHCIY